MFGGALPRENNSFLISMIFILIKKVKEGHTMKKTHKSVYSPNCMSLR